MQYFDHEQSILLIAFILLTTKALDLDWLRVAQSIWHNIFAECGEVFQYWPLQAWLPSSGSFLTLGERFPLLILVTQKVTAHADFPVQGRTFQDGPKPICVSQIQVHWSSDIESRNIENRVWHVGYGLQSEFYQRNERLCNVGKYTSSNRSAHAQLTNTWLNWVAGV